MDMAARALECHPDYTGVVTSWNDGHRGVTNSGEVSCFGNNITDVRLETRDKGAPMSKTGPLAPCLRPHNLNEKLGVITADRLFMVDDGGNKVTVQSVLENLPQYTAYRGIDKVSVGASTPERIVVRIQEAFVPLQAGQTETDVVPTHFSYQTASATDPRNLIVCGSAQGIFVHTDLPGANRLYAHKKPPNASVTEHFFTAEETSFAVGAAQCGDAGVAASRAKAVEMGIEGTGPHSNLFIVLSIPNKQAPRTRGLGGNSEEGPKYRGLGTARGARLSVSDETIGTATARSDVSVTRPEGEPIVATLLYYNTIRAQPGDDKITVSSSDVDLAVAHMERLYGACDVSCKLSELGTMLHKLTKEDMDVIRDTLSTVGGHPFKAADPYTPNPDAAKTIAGLA
jgi:hypothetical protein